MSRPHFRSSPRAIRLLWWEALSLLALALVAGQESDLIALDAGGDDVAASSQFYDLLHRGEGRALSKGIARDMLRCVRQCTAGQSDVPASNVSGRAAPPSCPSAKLMDYLLHGGFGMKCDSKPVYRRDEPPDGVVEIQLQFALYQFTHIDTKMQSVEMHGWWRYYWTDTRLAWNATTWRQDTIVVSSRAVWKPDITIFGLKSARQIGPESITCDKDGACYLLTQMVVQTTCPMELGRYPFDTQRCNMSLGSDSVDRGKFDVRPRKASPAFWADDGSVPSPVSAIDLASFSSNKEFVLTQVLVTTMDNTDQLAALLIDFTLVRQTLTYIYGMFVPLVLATFASFLMLMMPAPVSGSRPALNVTVLFTIATIYISSSNKLPSSCTDSLLQNTYEFAFPCAFAMTVVSVISTTFSIIAGAKLQQLQLLRDIFLAYDDDGSGSLSRQELCHALALLGVNDVRQALKSAGITAERQTFRMGDFFVIASVALEEGGGQVQPAFAKLAREAWASRRGGSLAPPCGAESDSNYRSLSDDEHEPPEREGGGGGGGDAERLLVPPPRRGSVEKTAMSSEGTVFGPDDDAVSAASLWHPEDAIGGAGGGGGGRREGGEGGVDSGGGEMSTQGGAHIKLSHGVEERETSEGAEAVRLDENLPPRRPSSLITPPVTSRSFVRARSIRTKARVH